MSRYNRNAMNLGAMIIFSHFAVASCSAQSNTGGAFMSSESDGNFIGVATMDADGILHVRVYQSSSHRETIDYDLKPSDGTYELARLQADNIRPNEEKKLRRILAIVSMAQDRSLRVSYFPTTGRDANEPIPSLPAGPTIVKPGDTTYDDLIRRVGGLELSGPGKPILAGK